MAHIANWLFLTSVATEIYPPRSTYRLQPLYISLFDPLATYHSQALGAHTDSLSAYRVFQSETSSPSSTPRSTRPFLEESIRSGWRKTGVELWDPAQVLKIFDKKASKALGAGRQSKNSLKSLLQLLLSQKLE
jgi:hypothetical protein